MGRRRDPVKELQAKVARRSGEAEVEAAAWDFVAELGFVDEALHHDRFDDLVLWYGRFRHGRKVKASGRALPGRKPTVPPRVIDLTEEEIARSNALSRTIIQEVGAIPAVKVFRDTTLLDGPLAPEQAYQFVSSPATRALTREQFVESEIPLDHHAHLEASAERRDAEGWEVRWSIFVDPPGGTCSIAKRFLLPIDAPLPQFEWVDYHWRVSRFTFWPGSLLDGLHRLCVALTEFYPWTQAEAAWFILTDDPCLDPISLRIGRIGYPDRHTRGRIDLSIDPWVSADTVKRTYRLMQRWMLARTGQRGGDNRGVSARSLAVFDFVQEQVHQTGKAPPFRELARQWNERWRMERPEWCFPEPLDKFKRTYDETRERLLSPQYTLVGDEPRPGPGEPRPNWRQSRPVRMRNWDYLEDRWRRAQQARQGTHLDHKTDHKADGRP